MKGTKNKQLSSNEEKVLKIKFFKTRFCPAPKVKKTATPLLNFACCCTLPITSKTKFLDVVLNVELMF
jgi:hypothetical protein